MPERDDVNEERGGIDARRWIRRPGAVWVSVGSDTLVAHPDLQERFRLEGVGVLLWERLGEPRNVSELVELVLAAYDVAPERAEVDVAGCVGSLSEQGLIVECGDRSDSWLDSTL